MMDLLNLIAEHALLTIAVTVITIVGFVFTYKSTPQKKLKVIISDNELITNKQTKFTKLKIFYDESNVDKLTVTKITFWNNSFAPIRNTDIAQTVPIAITIDNGNILDVSVLKGHDTPNNVCIENSETTPHCISFEYLNRKEGGLIQIIHTGDINSISIPSILIGGKIIVSKNPNLSTIKTGILSAFATILSFIASFVITTVMVYLGLPNLMALIVFCASTIGFIILTLFLATKEFVPKNCKEPFFKK